MSLLSPAGPLGFALMLLRDRVDRAARARAAQDRGATAIEWVLITAMLVIIAGVVFGVIYAKVKSAASNIDPNPKTPAGP